MHVAQSSGGGVARVVASLAAGQLASGDRVVVACLPDSRLSSAATQCGAEVLAWRATRQPGRGLPREVRDLYQLIESVRPDIVHLHSSKAGLAGRIAVRGRLPTVFQPHAWSFNAVSGGLRIASIRWEKEAARWAHQVVCVSEAERAQGVAAGVVAPYTVIPNGIDLDHFGHTEPAARDRARLRLGMAPSEPLAVCVGRLCRQKGQDILLNAWQDIGDRVPGARLVLVGDGPYRELLGHRAPPDVVFTGEIEDPRDWYLAADLVVLPSRWEGMALAPLEAMASGRAVVVTDVPGALESLPPGQAGRMLVPRGDSRALAAAVTALLPDRGACDDLGGQGRTHVRRHHDVRHVLEGTQAAYEAARRARGLAADRGRSSGIGAGRTSVSSVRRGRSWRAEPGAARERDR
ncbi:glycosyltransferase [Streptomyces sp. NPDC024017]|uniref:glycosyltransferase n=1 Tax=Streptomyces sp. NPDC024017 TaxID=3154326 RepID=UPI0033EC3D62